MVDITTFEQLYGVPIWILFLVVVWSTVWKGIALWKSAKRNSVLWFIILLVVNTVGILEILYIFLFSEIDLDKYSKSEKTRTKRKSIKQKKTKK